MKAPLLVVFLMVNAVFSILNAQCGHSFNTCVALLNAFVAGGLAVRLWQISRKAP